MSNLPYLRVLGGVPTGGDIEVQPSKNAALPILVASLLTDAPVTLHGVPRLADVTTLLEILSALGTRYSWQGPHSLTLQTAQIASTTPPSALVSRMRASFILLGALLSRSGEAHLGLPGGCTFGYRPVDQHLRALKAVGVELLEDAGSFHAHRPKSLSGGFMFEMMTVGGTQNAVLASVLGDHEVIWENCSLDTDVVDMLRFLNHLGADIQGIGSHTLVVRGVKALRGGEYQIIPDRLEAGTWMIAAAATRGQVTLRNVEPSHLRAISSKLQEIGARLSVLDQRTLQVDARRADLRPANVTASEYPGFPTDLQPVIGALLATVPGTSIVADRIYSRVTHVPELQRMGARIEVPDHTMVIQGASLHGAPVRAADIRSGASLVVAALAAVGETTIEGVEHIERGYEGIVGRLRSIGAEVEDSRLRISSAAS
jgi:UDP-N-acetylglucosamine 1-carboxyvinyltransferase